MFVVWLIPSAVARNTATIVTVRLSDIAEVTQRGDWTTALQGLMVLTSIPM